MSLLGILKFALKFLHVLAWPLFALGYPLCASIRAIENNSNSDTRKLVTYWISFSLVSLFEHSFWNLLQWIQFWHHIKLMIICLLVIPYFDGSFYVYSHLVRPYLFINRQVIIDEFNKWMVLLHKRDHFLVEAERYIKENGPEAPEKLIANESHKKEPDIVRKHNKAVEVTEKKEVPTAKQVVLTEPSLDQTDNRTSTTIEIKGPDVAIEAPKGLPDIPVSKKVQKEWTCAICQVTTTSEKTLNLHLQGKKHKATYEPLKPKNQPTPNKTAMKTAKKLSSVTYADEKGQLSFSLEREKKLPNIPVSKKVQKEWTCAICQVTTTSQKTLNLHLQGKKHKATYKLLKPKNQPTLNEIAMKIAKKLSSVIYAHEKGQLSFT